MPTLALTSFNIVCATLGGFITCFGLVSYLLKERFYLSEALISLIAGLIFSPHVTDLIKPLEYAQGDELALETITLYFCRLVLGVQLVLAGVQLPSRYLKLEWRSLALLLGPGMCGMWMATALLVWGLVPGIGFVGALAVGACVTPTDPILSNTIVKGKFADKNIPRELQKIIVAESGANDGLGYPFLFLPLYLLTYVYGGGQESPGGAGKAISMWFGETWAYVIILSVVYGAVVGFLAQELLYWAEQRKYVDRESFLVFAITLALFIVGTVGLIGSDDVLACFVAGNTLSWSDSYRKDTMDDSLQPTVDMLLNVAVFIWFGAVCPWPSFAGNEYIPIWRLILLGLLVLLLRRLPVVMALHSKIHQIENFRHALFVGFFGPIGVSAIFYLYITREYLHKLTIDGEQRKDAHKLSEETLVVVWFLTICSIIVHGISIPLGKLGFYLPRTISAAISSDRASFAVNMSRTTTTTASSVVHRQTLPSTTQPSSASSFLRRRSTADGNPAPPFASITTAVDRLRSLVSRREPPAETNPARSGSDTGGAGNISAPRDGRVLGRVVSRPEAEQRDSSRTLDTLRAPGADEDSDGADKGRGEEQGAGERAADDGDSRRGCEPRDMVSRRTIRFGDEGAPVAGSAPGRLS